MKAWLLDIDGTTLLGANALPGAAAFVTWLRDEGIPFLWVTNNTSLARGDWRRRLLQAGLAPRLEEIYTAGDATIDFLLGLTPVPRVHLVGNRALRRSFNAAGLVLDDETPDAVVLGYDTELTYAKLRAAALHLQHDVAYYATHPDRTCPTPDGPVPDVGSFIALFEQATGRTPEVIGKPEPTMATRALARLGVEAGQACMVGDRLATDIRMANDAGMHSCLVLTGVTSEADVAASSDVTPSHVFASIADVHTWAEGIGSEGA